MRKAEVIALPYQDNLTATPAFGWLMIGPSRYELLGLLK